MMKFGMVFECGPQGADRIVCPELAKRINPEVEIRFRTLNNKPDLIELCGSAAAQLIDDGCRKVFIMWDLRPAWPDRKSKPCMKEERQAMLASLKLSGVDLAVVYLVCIQYELEAWLIADERAQSTVLSRDAHPVRVKRRKNVHSFKNPKSLLNNLFKQNIGRRYVDRKDAGRIVSAMPDLERLRKVASFKRFEDKLRA